MTDMVKSPSHYMLMGQETITIIASSMNHDEWRGYCRGNAIKYRLRLGKKDSVEQDLGKAMYYEELYEMHKHLCRAEDEE